MIDTAPEIEEQIRESLLALAPVHRMTMAAEMFEAARRLVLASLPDELTEAERLQQLYQRLYGAELPWVPASDR